MLPQFPAFVKLAPEHGCTIEGHARAFPPYSDFTFASLWCWNLDGNIELSQLHGNLVVKFADYLTQAPFLSFIGVDAVLDTLAVLFMFLESNPAYPPWVKLVPEHCLRRLTLDANYRLVEDYDNYDYVYSVAELSTLPGKRYERHRNLVNRFARDYPWTLAVLNLSRSETWRDISALAGRWAERQRAQGNDVTDDIAALARVRQLPRHAHLFGLGLYVQNDLVAYSISELNDGRYATGLFEHADTTYAGVYAFLRKQLAVRLREMNCQYLNHQQDLGLPGLRRSKRSYRPIYYLRKFIIEKAAPPGSRPGSNAADPVSHATPPTLAGNPGDTEQME
jgi:hypothetical protein